MVRQSSIKGSWQSILKSSSSRNPIVKLSERNEKSRPTSVKRNLINSRNSYILVSIFTLFSWLLGQNSTQAEQSINNQNCFVSQVAQTQIINNRQTLGREGQLLFNKARSSVEFRRVTSRYNSLEISKARFIKNKNPDIESVMLPFSRSQQDIAQGISRAIKFSNLGDKEDIVIVETRTNEGQKIPTTVRYFNADGQTLARLRISEKPGEKPTYNVTLTSNSSYGECVDSCLLEKIKTTLVSPGCYASPQVFALCLISIEIQCRHGCGWLD